MGFFRSYAPLNAPKRPKMHKMHDFFWGYGVNFFIAKYYMFYRWFLVDPISYRAIGAILKKLSACVYFSWGKNLFFSM